MRKYFCLIMEGTLVWFYGSLFGLLDE